MKMERLYKSPVEPRLTVLTISGYLTWEKVAFSARKSTREVNKELLRQRNKKTMPVASLFLLCTWEKVTFPLNAASINLMATGCVLNRYPSRAIIALWPHWHAISGLVSCKVTSGDCRMCLDRIVWPTREPAANQGVRFGLRKHSSPAEVDEAVG